MGDIATTLCGFTKRVEASVAAGAHGSAVVPGASSWTTTNTMESAMSDDLHLNSPDDIHVDGTRPLSVLKGKVRAR
jgi:hypothetical protein